MKKASSVFTIAVGSRDPASPPHTEDSGLCKGCIFEPSDYSLFEGDYEIVHYNTKAGTRKPRQVKVCKNPHSGEMVETKGGNHTTLKEWKAAHGFATVESWLTK
ncbi:MAG: DNA binding protein [Pseudomonas sp.]|uniref:DNA binding protein n=1 Tax=Pseudomonas sp. TaxID=306 RepID=UPI003D6F9F42